MKKTHEIVTTMQQYYRRIQGFQGKLWFSTNCEEIKVLSKKGSEKNTFFTLWVGYLKTKKNVSKRNIISLFKLHIRNGVTVKKILSSFLLSRI